MVVVVVVVDVVVVVPIVVVVVEVCIVAGTVVEVVVEVWLSAVWRALDDPITDMPIISPTMVVMNKLITTITRYFEK